MPSLQDRLNDITLPTLPDSSELKKDIEHIDALNKSLLEKLKNAQRRVIVSYVRDSRKSGRVVQLQSTVGDLIWAGLSAIPVVGGYFYLARQVFQDPVRGAHMLLRTNYGSHWNVMGNNSNSVWSPLTYSSPTTENGETSGLEGYNLGNGRVTAFNSDKRMRLEQLECDINELVPTQLIFSSTNRSKGMSETQVKIHNQALLDTAMAKHRITVLTTLDMFPMESWLLYSFGMAVMGMEGDHEGNDDLDNDVFKGTADPHKGRLHWDKNKLYKKSSGRSNLHLAVTRYTAPEIYTRLTWRTGQNQVLPLLTTETIYRIESEKARIVAYMSEARENLAETTWDKSRQLIDQAWNATPKSTLATLPKGANTKKSRSGWSTTGTVLTALPRLLGAALPKKIYNYRTTFSSKDWARNLCAISVFYRILYAYIDKQLVCDDIPSARSLGFFVIAFCDAYNTAMAYFCHKLGLSGHRNQKWLASMLWSRLDEDPAIRTFLIGAAKFRVGINKGTSVKMPGLTGFKHVKSGLTRNDSYSESHGVTVGDVLAKIEETQQRSPQKKLNAPRGNNELVRNDNELVGPPEPQGVLRRNSSVLDEDDEPVIALTTEDYLVSKLSEVFEDPSLPPHLKECLKIMCELIAKKSSN